MSKPKEIVIGHIQIGTAHYEIAGIRRSDVAIDLTGRKIKRKTPIPQVQADLFERLSEGSGERKSR